MATLQELNAMLGADGGAEAMASAGAASLPSASLGALEQALSDPEEGKAEPKGKARLNAENQALRAANRRLSVFVRAGGATCAALLAVIGGLILYVRGMDARKFRDAFQVLAYREARTLQANAIVLAEYCKKLDEIREQVTKLPDITEEERRVRLQAIGSTIEQSEQLKAGFLKLMQDNEKERGKGSSFEYIDPFLKRPIKFDQELGGEISLDQLRDEVKGQARMDEAMQELRKAFLDPVPLADQMRAEAKRQGAPLIGPGGPVSKPDGPAAAPLQSLPGTLPK